MDIISLILGKKLSGGGSPPVVDGAKTMAKNGTTNTPAGMRYDPTTVNIDTEAPEESHG